MLITERAAGLAARIGQEGVIARIRARAATLALVAVLLLAGALRLTGLNWDDSRYLHPDERFLVMVTERISWPGFDDYFDSANSTLNPYNVEFGTYIYGTFPLFLVKGIGHLLGYRVYGDIHLAGRGLSALFDVGSVLLVYLIGRRLFGVRTGLLASLLLALTVLNIQAAHYYTVESFAVALSLATFFFALRADAEGRWWGYALTGVCAGLAVATKLSLLPIVGLVALPLIEQIRQGGWRAWRGRPLDHPRRLPVVLGVALGLVCALWAFRIAQPYAFAGPSIFDFRLDPRWTQDIENWRNVQAGIADMPPSHQWADRTPIVFVVDNLVRWGMGIPLGLTALVALALAGLRLATARRWPPTWQVVLVGWPLFHVLYYGTAFLKAMRYLLPAYPFLVLLAAALLIQLWDRGRVVWRGRLTLRWGVLPVVAVVAGTAFYALAFTSIYTRPVTRIAASEWIYQNIPAGTIAVTETAWDDGLPIPLPGWDHTAYPSQPLELYWEDNREKLDRMITLLDGAEYLFISSNRVYGSVPRIPERYPMTIAYYDLLFSGELGFELVKTFTSRPQLFGIELNDDGAEEAFTVYDHPKVLIYRKTAAFDPAAVEARLAAELTDEIVPLRPIQTGRNLLMMTEEERRTQQAGGTWSEIFDRGDLANRHPIRAWYLALQAMALAAVPLGWRLFWGLPDRGYALAKPLGLLTAGYVAWLLPSLRLVSFGRSAVLLGIGLTAGLSLAVVWPRRRAFVVDLRSRWREILVAELLFVAAFFAFVWLRSLNPDLWHRWRGGEKPMEFAYFNAVIRSTHFPPYDPWFAGGYLNYYYYGYALLASLTRLTGVIPSVAFNLAVPTVFALTVVGAWSFVANVLRLLTRELRWRRPWAPLTLGLLGPLFVAVIGNLDFVMRIGRGEWGYPGSESTGVVAIVRGLWNALRSDRPLPTDAFWASSRIIDGTVNEFPYWSFLFADLHPHLIALPFTLAALLVGLAIVGARRWPPDASAPVEVEQPLFGPTPGWRQSLRSLPRRLAAERIGLLAVAGFVTGALYPLNTWDYPTYALVIAGAFLLLEVVGGGGEGWRLSYASLRRAALWTIGALLFGRLLYLPYFASFQRAESGFIPWREARTTPPQYLAIHGFLLFLVTSYLLAELAAALPRRLALPLIRPSGLAWDVGRVGTAERRLDASLVLAERPLRFRPLPWATLAAYALLLVAVWRVQLSLLLGGVLLLALAVAWLRRDDPLRLLLCGMIGLAAGISLAVERYTLRGDVGRMNTVFKFYLQVWVLLALAAAIGTVVLIARHRGLVRPALRVAWAAVALVLLLGSLTFPALATGPRLDDRFLDLPRTLDGMAYMPRAIYDDQPDDRPAVSFTLDGDYRAITWLLDNVEGSPVVLEAITPLYRWGSRVSVYTGLPAVLGWDWHQTQQRGGYGPLIDRRRVDVGRMLGEVTTFEAIRPLLDKYRVSYVYVGELERAYYPPAALRKFADAADRGLLEVVYQEAGVTIYRYDGAGA